MRKSIILNTAQVLQLQDTGTVAVVDMVKVQPPDNRYTLSEILSTTGDNKNIGKLFWALMDKDGYSIIDGKQPLFPALHRPGSTLYVRENTCNFEGGIIYCADKNYNSIVDGDLYNWKSAATMPKSAARLNATTTDVLCVRLKDISHEQLMLLGFSKCTLGYSPIWYENYHDYIISRFGLYAWYENRYIFITTLKLNK